MNAYGNSSTFAVPTYAASAGLCNPINNAATVDAANTAAAIAAATVRESSSTGPPRLASNLSCPTIDVVATANPVASKYDGYPEYTLPGAMAANSMVLLLNPTTDVSTSDNSGSHNQIAIVGSVNLNKSLNDALPVSSSVSSSSSSLAASASAFAAGTREPASSSTAFASFSFANASSRRTTADARVIARPSRASDAVRVARDDARATTAFDVPRAAFALPRGLGTRAPATRRVTTVSDEDAVVGDIARAFRAIRARAGAKCGGGTTGDLNPDRGGGLDSRVRGG